MRRILFVFCLFCFSCSDKSKTPAVHVSLAGDNHSVKFTGLDYAVMSEINRDSAKDIWQYLLPVYRMPADTEMKDYQPVQHGAYRLNDSAVVFTPDTPFVKGRAYFMRYYEFSKGGSPWDLISSKNKLGSLHYKDLVFK